MSERLTKAEFRMLETWAYSTRGTCDRFRASATLWSAEPEHIFLSGGYNGAPSGLPSCDEYEVGHLMVDEHCIRGNHAEENAILNCLNQDRLSGGIATMLGTPCYPCARKLVSKKIANMEYIGSYDNKQGPHIETLFKDAGVIWTCVSIDELLKTLKKAFDFSGSAGGIFKDIVLPVALFGPHHTNIRLMDGGKLIIFEGIDGCGKSTQIKLLEKYLIQKGYQVFVTREPGGGLPDIRERLFNLKEEGEENLAMRELDLFEEDRRAHYENKILPALASGKIVISDRGPLSTVAYQGYGRGLDLELIERANKKATFGREADLTIFMDINVDDALDRLQKDVSRKINRFEKKEFLEKVKMGYHEEAIKQARGGKWQTVWADAPEAVVLSDIKVAVEERLEL